MLCKIGMRLSSRGNIVRASAVENLFRTPNPVRTVAVDRKQNPTFLHPTFVTLRFVFRDAHTYKRAY